MRRTEDNNENYCDSCGQHEPNLTEICPQPRQVVPTEDKKIFGPLCNQLKIDMQNLYQQTFDILYQKEQQALAKKALWNTLCHHLKT